MKFYLAIIAFVVLFILLVLLHNYLEENGEATWPVTLLGVINILFFGVLIEKLRKNR